MKNYYVVCHAVMANSHGPAVFRGALEQYMPLGLSRNLHSLNDVRNLENGRNFSDVVTCRSIYKILAEQAQIQPDSRAVTYHATADDLTPAATVSYGQLRENVVRLANSFLTVCEGKTVVVAYILPSVIETVVTFTTGCICGTSCPINPLLKADEIVHLLEVTGANILVVPGKTLLPAYWEKVEFLLKKVDKKILVVTINRNGSAQNGTVDFWKLLEQGDRTEIPFLESSSDKRVVACLHTGGTTASPKLARLTEQNLIYCAWACGSMWQFSPMDRVANGLPLFHVAGIMDLFLATTLAGGETVLLSASGLRNQEIVKNYWKIVDQYGITVAGGVPTSLLSLSNVPIDSADIGTLRVCLTGASPLSPQLATKFERHVGVPIQEVYGMTECSGVIAICPPGGRLAGTVGIVSPFVEVSIGKPEDTNDGAKNLEKGEIWVRGPNVFLRPDAGNTQVFEKTSFGEGWFATGDIGCLGEDGYLSIVGRSKDLIIRSGHNIDPAMIEEAVLDFPAVKEAAAVGQPDPYAGEVPVLFVTLIEGMQADADEIMEFAKSGISEPPAYPKAVYIKAAFPLTAIGKVFKPALRAEAALESVRLILSSYVPLADKKWQAELQMLEDGAYSIQLKVSGLDTPDRGGLCADILEYLNGLDVRLELTAQE